jgi:FkbM family methyltransferase
VFLDLIAQSPDCLVIDVGSSYGAYALSAAARAATHPVRGIIAIEPDERCMTAFKRSVAENGFADRIRSVRALAGSYSGIGELHVSPASSTSNRSFGPSAVDDGARTGSRTVRLRATRVDDEMQQENLTPPLRLVVKMDVEGSESRVLTGMNQTLAAAESVALLFEYYPTGMRAVGLGPDDLQASLNGHTWTRVMVYEDSTLRELASPELLWEHLARYYRDTVGRHEAINVILLNGPRLAVRAP